MKFLFLSLAALVIVAQPVTAQDSTTFASNLELLDQSSQKQSFDALTGENGLVVVFYRSAKWCPYCQVQLIELEKGKQAILDKGYNVVGVSYDNVADLNSFATKKDISFPLLSDNGSQVIRRLGIFNEGNKEGSFAYGVPHPTIYVVKHDKTIKALLAEEGYKIRPSVEDIVAELN